MIEDINSIYELGKHIGSGSFGNVCKAKRISTNTLCALKIVSKE